jgi:hypothetical protein
MGIENNPIADRTSEQLDRLIKERNDIHKQVDSVIILIATGLFLLSINFIVGFNDNYLVNGWLLIISWLFILLAIIFHVANLLTAARQRSYIVEASNRGEDVNKVARQDEKLKNLKWWSNASLYASMTTLLLSIALLTLFGILNFQRINQINKDNIPNRTQLCSDNQTLYKNIDFNYFECR